MKAIKPTKTQFTITADEMKVVKDFKNLCSNTRCFECSLYDEHEESCILEGISSFLDFAMVVEKNFIIADD